MVNIQEGKEKEKKEQVGKVKINWTNKILCPENRRKRKRKWNYFCILFGGLTLRHTYSLAFLLSKFHKENKIIQVFCVTTIFSFILLFEARFATVIMFISKWLSIMSYHCLAWLILRCSIIYVHFTRNLRLGSISIAFLAFYGKKGKFFKGRIRKKIVYTMETRIYERINKIK